MMTVRLPIDPTRTRGCLPVGTETHLGVIQRVSLTAYLIDGQWVSFDVFHPLAVATPLVVLR